MTGDRTGGANIKTLLIEQSIVLWKRKWIAVAACWAICVLGWATVWAIPNRYESDARAYFDVNGLLTPLLKGLIVETPPSQSADYLRQTLLSRPNLEQVIYLADLVNPGASNATKEGLITDLASDVSIKPEGPNLISLSYSNENPVVAKNVVQALLTVFAERATSSNRAEMDDARKFLDRQIANYEAQLRAAEKRRADFRKKYTDYFADSGVPRLELLQQQIAQYQQQYQDAQIVMKSLAAQMRQVPQVLDVNSAPTVSNSGEIVTAPLDVRLAQAKRNLSALQLVDTNKHPDVISAERVVKELEAQVKSHGGDAEGQVQVPNPAYESIKLKYIDAETAVPLAKERLEQTTAEYNRVRKLNGNIPDILAKAKDVDRNYDLIKANYDELVKRRQSATLSQAADDQADRTQFRIVDPPQVPITPAFPDRPLLFSVVLLIGLAGGIGVPLFLAQMEPTFGSVSHLRELGLPVIGAVAYVRHAGVAPFLATPAARMFVASSVCLFALYGCLMVISTGLYRGIL
jgi:polysaccharide chain length determinant protein (PEP-CTERM system associated)